MQKNFKLFKNNKSKIHKKQNLPDVILTKEIDNIASGFHFLLAVGMVHRYSAGEKRNTLSLCM